MKKDYFKFPNIDCIKKSIKKLESYNWPTFENDPETYSKKIIDAILKEFKVLPQALITYTKNDFDLKFFRVREFININDANLFTEHSYPPTAYTKQGRCNFPLNPVFYCSNNPISALNEVIRKTDCMYKQYCFSKWAIIDSDEEYNVQSYLHTDLHNENDFIGFRNAEIETYKTLISNIGDDETISAFFAIKKFMDDIFINDENYLLSASIAHDAIYAKHLSATDILIYPSLQNDKKSVNMAIHPNFVDNRMKIERLYIGHPTSNNIKINTDAQIAFTHFGDVINRHIVWKTCKDNFEEFMDRYNLDFS